MNEKKRHGRPRSRFTAQDILGWLLIPALLLGVPALLMSLLQSDTPEEPGAYRFYRGPIQPLSSLSVVEEIEAERLVTLDFGVYEEEETRYHEEILVTDTYTLTNPTGEAVTTELSWGFYTQTANPAPVITVDGESAQAQMYPCRDPDGTLNAMDHFQDYAAALTEGDFLNVAMTPTPEWDVPVKVYHFYNIAYEGTEPNVWLNVTGKYGKDTNLWVRTYGACTQEKDSIEVIFMVGEEAWLYVIGDDLEELTINGSLYRSMGGGLAKYPEVEGVTYEVETYESTFMECLWEAAQAYTPEDVEPGTIEAQMTPEMRYDYAMRSITGGGTQLPGGFHSMNTLLSRATSYEQLCYWVFPVEIPAGGSITVSVTHRQICSDNGDYERHGYDIATTLGSNLNFQEQTARLVNTEPVVIAQDGAAQNFGFDLNTGILEVTLDLAQERYFIDLLRAETE